MKFSAAIIILLGFFLVRGSLEEFITSIFGKENVLLVGVLLIIYGIYKYNQKQNINGAIRRIMK